MSQSEPIQQYLALFLDKLPGSQEPGPYRFKFLRLGEDCQVQIPTRKQDGTRVVRSSTQARWLSEALPSGQRLRPGRWQMDEDSWTGLLDTIENAGGKPPWRAQLLLAQAEEEWEQAEATHTSAYRNDSPVDDETREQARVADLATVDQAVILAGDWSEPLLIRAHRRLNWHRDAAASLADCRAAEEIDPDNPSVLAQLSIALRFTGELSDELKALEKASKLPSAGPSHWHLLAEAWRRRGRHGAAASAFSRAAELDPRDPIFATEAALAHAANGNTDAALETLDKVTADHPDYGRGHTERGRLLLDFPGREDEALEALNRAIKADATGSSASFDALALRGTLCRIRGDYETAVADLKATLGMAPSHFTALGELGVCLEALGRHDDALGYLDSYLARSAWVPALIARARIRLAKEDPEGAKDDLQSILDAVPGHELALEMLKNCPDDA
ncbi:MAG: tetratricopeptide repeat protein [Proteobacteria bacterium]|nr:tetratricopeptide repeat protein [Pseudomonadota bacterium]